MAWAKEISEVLRKRVVVACQAKKGYKTIPKEFGLHKSTGRQIGGNSRPLLPAPGVVDQKDHSKARHVIVYEVAEDSRVNFN